MKPDPIKKSKIKEPKTISFVMMAVALLRVTYYDEIVGTNTKYLPMLKLGAKESHTSCL
jgi:hypothetical protein